MKRILILGASGTFGKALVERLCSGNKVLLTLASRHASACFTESQRIRVVDCDAMDIDGLQRVMADCQVVYCAISGNDLPAVARNIVVAMRREGVHRLIFMGAVGIYNEIPTDMDDEDNVRNNPDQVPNRLAVDVVENSGLDYTVLRPGYLQDGDAADFILTFKGEQAKGYISTIPSVVALAERLISDDTLYVGQSVSITCDLTKE